MRGGIGLDDGGGSGIQLMDCFHDAVNGDAIHFEELLVGCALTELILDADLADARTTFTGNNLRNASTEAMHDRVVFNRDRHSSRFLHLFVIVNTIVDVLLTVDRQLSTVNHFDVAI